jgi:hypothetical protein
LSLKKSWVFLPSLIAAMALCLTASVASGQKTDILVLKNGDRITGEVEELTHGLLRYGTDDAGKLKVEWDQVSLLTSKNIFEVELETRRKLIGTLSEGPEPGTMEVAGEVFPMQAIVAITEISRSFWAGTSGYLDVGWTLAKANEAHTATIGAEGRHRGDDWGSTAKFSFYEQGQDSTSTTRNTSASIDVNRFLDASWALRLFAEASHNDEMNRDLRTLLGAGARRRIARTNRLDASWTAGLSASSEKYSDGEDSTLSSEFVAAADFAAFRLDSPELDLTSHLMTYTGLTERGRFRGDFDIRASYELLSDFFLALTLEIDFDSKPPTDDPASNVDYTSAISVGWSW